MNSNRDLDSFPNSAHEQPAKLDYNELNHGSDMRCVQMWCELFQSLRISYSLMDSTEPTYVHT